MISYFYQMTPPRQVAADTTPPIAPSAPATATRRRGAKEQDILDAAQEQFAQHGYGGASIETIAAGIGMTRHSLLYYYASKEQLYVAVLNRIVDRWLEGMQALSIGDDPAKAIAQYIAVKMRFSKEQPSGSRVFTQEIIAGAPRYKAELELRVKPVLQRDIATFQAWAKAGRVRKLDFMHLMFLLWATTQAYADLAPQFALLLGKPELEATDYDAARTLITDLVLRGLQTKG